MDSNEMYGRQILFELRNQLNSFCHPEDFLTEAIEAISRHEAAAELKTVEIFHMACSAYASRMFGSEVDPDIHPFSQSGFCILEAMDVASFYGAEHLWQKMGYTDENEPFTEKRLKLRYCD